MSQVLTVIGIGCPKDKVSRDQTIGDNCLVIKCLGTKCRDTVFFSSSLVGFTDFEKNETLAQFL